MARSPRERDIWLEVAGSRLAEWSRFISAGLRSGSDHSTENRSITYKLANPKRVVGFAAPVAFHHSLQQSGRLGLRLVIYEGSTSILACATAQEAHQTGCASRWPSQHWLAQLPPHCERMGQGSGSRTGGREDASPARG